MGKVYGNWVTEEGQRPEGGPSRAKGSVPGGSKSPKGVPEALRASLKTNTNLTNLTNARKNIRVIAQGAEIARRASV